MNNVKIYDGGYISFYPHIKQGKFTLYYPDGTIRKSIEYLNNKPLLTMEYFRNGNLHRKYALVNDEIIYNEVYNDRGNSILEGGNGSEQVFDSIRKLKLTYEYKGRRLTNIYYYTEEDKKIYQLCEQNAEFKGFKSIQSKLFFDFEYPGESIKLNRHGYVLAKCLIDLNGLVSDINLVKGIDENCDRQISEILSSMTTKKFWKPAEIQKENVYQEVVIPIVLSIKGFSGYNKSFYYWMNQQMINQQMMQYNQLKPLTPKYVPTY